jgi:hypothetical protein
LQVLFANISCARPRARFESPVSWAVRGRFACLALLTGALLSGCAGLALKRPQAAQPSALPVKGHAPSDTQRDRRLQIGSYEVSAVSGTPMLPAGLSAYGRVQEQTEWDYRFEVRGHGKLLRAECTERVGSVRFYGFGQVLLDLSCRCVDGATQAAALKLVEEKGSVTLPGSRYALRASRQSQQGKASRNVLGYRLSGGLGEGAVDTTKHARAYLPKDVPEADRGPLVCVYAALLLHRHEK